MPEDIKTAVIYARFSCSKQREASIDDQLRVCRDWCAREGYAIVGEYSDYAMSGRSDDRPQFQKMVANAGESDIVLVYMMDRFSRDEYDAPAYKHELRRKGVEVVSAMEAMPDGPERILIEKIYEGLAAVESVKTSMRTRRGMEGNALKCKTNGVRVYGYGRNEDDEYVVNEDEAAIVREAFRRSCDHEPVDSIASDFARRGVTTRTGRPCGYSMVYQMLHNRKYTGFYSWGGIEVDGGMPQIIDKATFAMAQEVKPKKRRASEDWGAFALSGRAICSECGHNMAGTSGRGKKNVKYEYYGCRCGAKPVRRDWLEHELAEAIRGMLRDRETALRISHMLWDEPEPEIADARRRAMASKRKAENGLQNIMAAIEQGIVMPEFTDRIAQLQAQKARAERDLASYDEARIDPEEFADFLQCGGGMDDAAVLDSFVYQVMVTPEECVATLYCDDERNEPARLSIARVRTFSGWCPQRDSNPRYPP